MIMKNRFLLFLAAAILFMGETYAQSESDNLTDAQKAFVLGRLCSEVKYNYVFYNDLTFDWDSLCQASLPELLATKSFNEFTYGLKRLTAKLNDGHTTAVGNSPDKTVWIRPLPIKTKRIGNQVFVTSVLSSEFREKGVKPGTEIVEINDMNVIEYGYKYRKPYIASSTHQWSEYRPFNEFELTKGEGNKVLKILFKNKEGKPFICEGDRNNKWDIDDSTPIFDYELFDGNIGLLKVNTFMGNDFVNQFNRIYDEIVKSDKLIIDLRDNTGGNSGYANYMLRHFSNAPIKQSLWSSRMYIAAHGSWNYPQEWYMQTPGEMSPLKDKTIYTKPIVVLTNACTFSSSENFCAVFIGMQRGKIIGTTTGGSTGNPIGVDLGYGVYGQICTKNDVHIDGSKFIGVGIKPDIEVNETTDMFLNNKDVVLEEALRQL